MMNICRLVCLHPFSALLRHEVSMFPPIQSVANQSGDARSCVSRVRNAFIISISLRAFHCHRVARGYVSLASQNSRTNARDGYTDMKTLPRGIAGNEYLCNKDSKKSLHFLLSKEKTKTVPSSTSHRLVMHLHTLRTVIKPTPADIPHRTVMPVPPSRTTEKHFPHHKKAFPTPQESPYRDTEKALPKPGRHRLATQKHTFL